MNKSGIKIYLIWLWGSNLSMSASHEVHGTCSIIGSWNNQCWPLLLWRFRFLGAKWSENLPPHWPNTMANPSASEIDNIPCWGWERYQEGRGVNEDWKVLWIGFESRYSFAVLRHPLLIQRNKHRSPASITWGNSADKEIQCHVRKSPSNGTHDGLEEKRGQKKNNLAISYPESLVPRGPLPLLSYFTVFRF